MTVRAFQRDGSWTATFLQKTIREKLQGRRLVVVSNREPYMHEYGRDLLVCERPASGMVSAIDPVLQACGGLWVAHGSGSADRLVVDEQDRIEVPPELHVILSSVCGSRNKKSKGIITDLQTKDSGHFVMWCLPVLASTSATGLPMSMSIKSLPMRFLPKFKIRLRSYGFRIITLHCCHVC